jgi:hypothetical protein
VPVARSLYTVKNFNIDNKMAIEFINSKPYIKLASARIYMSAVAVLIFGAGRPLVELRSLTTLVNIRQGYSATTTFTPKHSTIEM